MNYALKNPVQATCPICRGIMPVSKEGKFNLPFHLRASRMGAAFVIKKDATDDPLFSDRCPGSEMAVMAKPITEPEETSKVEAPADTDPFPFGKHKELGHTYGEVPADYFDWFRGQLWAKRWPKVLAYIAANERAIDKDLPD